MKELEEGEFPAIDKLVEFLKSTPTDDRDMVSNPIRLAQMEFCCMVLHRIFKESNSEAVMEYTQGKIDRKMGGIVISVEAFDITNTKDFAKISDFADAVEIEPLLSGKIRISLTFRNLLIPLE